MKGSNFFKNILDHVVNDGVYFVNKDKKITYWNKGAELITGYGDSKIIGKKYCDNIKLHKDCKDKNLCETSCPLEKSMKSGNPITEETFFNDKDGKNFPVLIKLTPIKNLRDEIIGVVEVFSDNSSKVKMLQEVEELRQLALHDFLTNIPNRRYLDMRLKSKLEEFHRYGWNFGLLFLDIDFFKNFNDCYGHDNGDKILKIVSSTISNVLRPFDIFGRWGGEEFIAIIVNVNKKIVSIVAERIRNIIEKLQLTIDEKINMNVTISIGGTLVKKNDTIETLFKRIDENLYKSKNTGRNKATIS